MAIATVSKPKTATSTAKPTLITPIGVGMKCKVTGLGCQAVGAALANVVFASDDMISSYALGSVQLTIDPRRGSIQAVATDGRCMASDTRTQEKCKLIFDDPAGNDDITGISMLIPRADAKKLGERLTAVTASGLVLIIAGENVRVEWRTRNRGQAYSFTASDGRFPKVDEHLEPLETECGGLVFAAVAVEPPTGVTVDAKGQFVPTTYALAKCTLWGEQVNVLFNPQFLHNWLDTFPVPKSGVGVESVKLSWIDEHSRIRCECGTRVFVFMPLDKDQIRRNRRRR